MVENREQLQVLTVAFKEDQAMVHQPIETDFAELSKIANTLNVRIVDIAHMLFCACCLNRLLHHNLYR